jgi:hypothetical protein
MPPKQHHCLSHRRRHRPRLASFDCIGDSIILVYHRHHAARGGRKAPPPALQTISNAPANTINTLNNHPIGLHHSWSEWGVERSLFGFIVAGDKPTSCEPPEPLQSSVAWCIPQQLNNQLVEKAEQPGRGSMRNGQTQPQPQLSWIALLIYILCTDLQIVELNI